MNKRFLKHKVGMIGLAVVLLYFIVGLYAPLLASSHPFIAVYKGDYFFPWFRYLFYPGYYTKVIDIFFNILMFTLPLTVIACIFWRRSWIFGVLVQLFLFGWLVLDPPSNPEADFQLLANKQMALKSGYKSSWDAELPFLSPYAKLNELTEDIRLKAHDQRIRSYLPADFKAYTPYLIKRESEALNPSYSSAKNEWREKEEKNITFILWPFLREFHWEDDAGGDQSLNSYLPWWEITRTNRKDFIAALLFGIRISLSVGFLSIAIALLIGVPIGAAAGFFAGKTDIIVSRLLEVWEAMPTFFMLLLIVAMTQSKSIFIVIFIIGLFGWTGFSRYIRGEFFKERSLPYVEACRILGYSDTYTIFKHVLPNAIAPVLTLLPFAILGAISAEAGLSFLGLGEEGSSSWGVLMDEGRQAFPGESYLLWPPAILLTVLLVAIAMVGDALRDSLDPKLKR